MRVPGTPYAAPFSQVFFAEASKDERELLGLGREGEGGCLLRSRPLLGATWATWPGRERRKRPNLNRWEDNDERQKIPRTTSHRTPSHPIPSNPAFRWRLGHVEPVHPAGRGDLWDAPPVPGPSVLTVAGNRQTWTNLPTATDTTRPTSPTPL